MSAYHVTPSRLQATNTPQHASVLNNRHPSPCCDSPFLIELTYLQQRYLLTKHGRFWQRGQAEQQRQACPPRRSCRRQGWISVIFPRRGTLAKVLTNLFPAVVARSPIRKQRLSREQGADNRRYNAQVPPRSEDNPVNIDCLSQLPSLHKNVTSQHGPSSSRSGIQQVRRDSRR